MNSGLRELIQRSLIKDFNDLYVKKFTTDWKTQRLIRSLEIDVMSFTNLERSIIEWGNHADYSRTV